MLESSRNGEALAILKKVDFTINRGEALAILGPSGSGKSTLLSLLVGLDTPIDGSVEVAGVDIFQLDEDARALLRGKDMGFVFQSFQLLPSFTALENVMLPLEIAGSDKAREIAGEILKRVGLENRLQHYPRQLSGGEQQRVAIARAFVSQPQILLADEPTGNLDQKTGEKIMNLLFELNKEHGTTLVLVTHDEAFARRCDRALYLDAGELKVDAARN